MDFGKISTFKLPHRSKQETISYFRREDAKNHYYVDRALKWHRETQNRKKGLAFAETQDQLDGLAFEDVIQMSCDLSIADTSDDCCECAHISMQMTQVTGSSVSGNMALPSLDDVLEETSFLDVCNTRDVSGTGLFPPRG